MFDGHALSQLHAVRIVCDIVRKKWSVWAGLLTLSGQTVPVGRASRYAPMATCHGFQSRFDGKGSCTASVRQWAAALEDERMVPGVATVTTCHAGLSTLVRPVTSGGRVVGALYLSGFLRESAELSAQRRQMSRRARELGLTDASLGTTPTLSAADVALAEELLDALAEEVEAWLHDHNALNPVPDDPRAGRYGEILGHSPAMEALFRVLDKIKHSESTVLIQGENGTGKELLARAIHFSSPRRHRPFVAQNCSALNDNLLDSELFGHKRGAFTGAVTDKLGLFDIADGGTFFLDEIGDMSPTLQVKLLRVLQEGTFLPVGDTITRKVDVRIIAATNRDLKSMIEANTFRQDLYYRVNVINLVAPPLRERRDDIPDLVEHFTQRATRELHTGHKRLGAGALKRMLAYQWPGNVRELENEVERLVVLAGDAELIDEHLLSRRILKATGEVFDGLDDDRGDLQGALETLERRMLLEGLKRCAWNKTRTARELGISRRNLIRKVATYDLERFRTDP